MSQLAPVLAGRGIPPCVANSKGRAHVRGGKVPVTTSIHGIAACHIASTLAATKSGGIHIASTFVGCFHTLTSGGLPMAIKPSHACSLGVPPQVAYPWPSLRWSAHGHGCSLGVPPQVVYPCLFPWCTPSGGLPMAISQVVCPWPWLFPWCTPSGGLPMPVPLVYPLRWSTHGHLSGGLPMAMVVPLVYPLRWSTHGHAWYSTSLLPRPYKGLVHTGLICHSPPIG